MVQALAPRADFPILSRSIEGKRLIYLDSAATALKPEAVIAAVSTFYRRSTANVHRGSHLLGQEASEAFEAVRDTVARFINATAREIVFTANCTEAINIVAEGLELEPGDNVVSTIGEHHSNLLPWMRRAEVRLAQETGDGRLDLAALERSIDSRTRVVAVGHASNVTGEVRPIGQVVELAHRAGAAVLVDGAQSAPHLPIDVDALGCDFFAFSAHKMLGPSGTGVLFLSERMWDRMKPLKLGGGTVDHVRERGFDLKRIPYCYEAGTPNIEGVLGLGAAIDYLERLGMNAVARHERELVEVMHRELVPDGMALLGPTSPEHKIAIVALSPRELPIEVDSIAMALSDSFKVMARSGTHCAHPYFERCGRRGALRFSAHVYTSEEDIAAAGAALRELLAGFGAQRR